MDNPIASVKGSGSDYDIACASREATEAERSQFSLEASAQRLSQLKVSLLAGGKIRIGAEIYQPGSGL